MAIDFTAVDTPTTEANAKPQSKGFSFGKRQPGATDRMFFTEQLSLLLETGESLHSALTTIASQSDSPVMAKMVAEIAEDVSDGQTFANALAAHDSVFSATYINLIAASEGGGFIDKVLQQLLDMDKQREALRNTLTSAATYPMFLIAFSVAVVVFVLVVVFPKFGTMFQSIYNELPASTRVLMTMSDVLRQHWWAVLAACVAFLVLVRQWLASETGRSTLDHWKLRIPGVRDLFAQIYLVQSLQVLSLSLANGVSVMDSLAACRDVVGNTAFRKLIARIENNVQSGGGVAAGFASAEFVPSLAKQMIMTGEKTGNLGKVTARVAEYYNTQLSKKLDAFSKLAEPIMLLVMGAVVGILVSSLILPIFKLSSAVA